jgi:hypothetical protein
VCIAASVIGVVLLIVDAVRERSWSDEASEGTPDEAHAATDGGAEDYEDYPDETPDDEPEAETTVVEQADEEAVDEDKSR